MSMNRDEWKALGAKVVDSIKAHPIAWFAGGVILTGIVAALFWNAVL